MAQDSKPKLQVKRVRCTKDLLPQLAKALEDVMNKQILVGIPAGAAGREAGSGEGITNAQLGYIHEFGSPEANIPPRPFLIPGIEKVQDQVAERLKNALREACKGGGGAAQLEAVGVIASSSAKREVGENGPPLKPATIRNRQRGRQTKSMRASEKRYLELTGVGMDSASAQAAAGVRPLVDTGQLRNSITYVVRQSSKLVKIPLQELERATTPAIPKGKTVK